MINLVSLMTKKPSTVRHPTAQWLRLDDSSPACAQREIVLPTRGSWDELSLGKVFFLPEGV